VTFDEILHAMTKREPFLFVRLGSEGPPMRHSTKVTVRAGKSCSALTNAKNGRCYFFDEM